jgi:hypothetical protein
MEKRFPYHAISFFRMVSIFSRITGTEIFPPQLNTSLLASTNGSCTPGGMGGQAGSNRS